MKITTFYAHLFLCALALSSSLCIANPDASPEETPKPAPKALTLDYKDPIHFMSDFLNPDIKPEKSLKYWAGQLILLLRSNTRLLPFCNDLKNIALDKEMNADERTKRISKVFLDTYMQQLFAKDMSNFILSKGLNNVKAAIQKRAAKP